MDEKYKNEFDEHNEYDEGRKTDEEKRRESYYYSYGPFKSVERSVERPLSSDIDLQRRREEDELDVTVTQPAPTRSYHFDPREEEKRNIRAWQYQKAPKRSPFKSIFLSFLAGAVIIGGLMFTSDRMNWFGGDQGVLFGASPSAGVETHDASSNVQSSSGDSSGVVNANLLDVIRPGNIADIVKQSSPAVVKIETYVKSAPQSQSPFFDDPFFRQFFGDDYGQQLPSQNQDDGKLREAGLGSGFIFDKSGYILTNDHVVEGADEIQVTVEGYSKPFKATLLGHSYDLDLAALKIEGTDDFPTLKFGKVDDMQVGDWLVAIGNPYGFDHTVTVGVFSAKGREIQIPDGQRVRNYKHLIQTDASINPGNSGGPLLNLNGEVVGINTAVSTQAQGIGFAIPTSTITEVLDNLKNNVKVPQPYIGVGITDIQENWVKEFKLENTDGVIISSVVQDSPAEMAGLQPRDVILKVDGEKVKNAEELQTKIKSHKVGDLVKISFQRDGVAMITSVKVGDQAK